MRPARFITVEGIEGSGKSTLLAGLAVRAAAAGIPLLLTREPGGTELGRRLRAALLDPALAGMDPLAELLLYAADRAQHVATVIRPALARGTSVLCDRGPDATRAYQGHARGLGVALVDRLDAGRLRPDLTLLLDLPAEAGLARARRRNAAAALEHESRFEREELAFHERVREGYLAIAAAEPARVRVLDARLAPPELERACWELLVAVLAV